MASQPGQGKALLGLEFIKELKGQVETNNLLAEIIATSYRYKLYEPKQHPFTTNWTKPQFFQGSSTGLSRVDPIPQSQGLSQKNLSR